MMRICVIAAVAIAVSSFLATAQDAATRDHDEQGHARADQKNAESIDVRIAEVKLKLAETELRRATEVNRRVARTIPDSTVGWLGRNVELAKQQVDLARQGDQHWHALHIRQMEAALRDAESRVQRAEGMNRRVPSSVGEFDLERLRLKAEIARLNLAKARDPANVNSPEAHLQWQVDQLRDEIDRLKDQVERLSITSEARL